MGGFFFLSFEGRGGRDGSSIINGISFKGRQEVGGSLRLAGK